MKKILFVHESFVGGGAENILLTLLRSLDKNKFEVHLCSVINAGSYSNSIPNDIGFSTIIEPPKGKSFVINSIYKLKYYLVYKLLPARWIYKFYIPKGFDVEIAFIEGFATKILSCSTNKYAKKIAWVHIDLLNNHHISSVYRNNIEEKKSYNHFDTVVGVSNTVTNSLNTLYDLKNILTLYNPIDAEKIVELSAEKIDLPHTNRLRLVSVGRLAHQKGFDRLLTIFKQLIQEEFDLELFIIGGGPDKDKLQHFIHSNSLGQRVFLKGHLQNPYALMANCDLFVCSSRSEGYSTAVTEALILGLPIVTTLCSGMTELLGDNQFGVVTKNDSESLFEGIKDMIINKPKREHYQKQSELRGKDFALQNLIKPIEQLLLK